MQVHAAHQRRVQPLQRRLLADRLRPALRQRRHPAPVQHMPVRHPDASRPASTRSIPGKMVAAPVVNCICSSSSRAAVLSPRATSPEASSACGSDANARPPSICAVYSGLIPNGSRVSVTRALRPLMDRDRIHPAQRPGIGRPVAQPQMQRRLAVALRREMRARQPVAQLAVVVDLAIGHQRGRPGDTAAGRPPPRR